MFFNYSRRTKIKNKSISENFNKKEGFLKKMQYLKEKCIILFKVLISSFQTQNQER